ncbi:lytic transglycosylase domain-containing protein [Rhodoferax ferrireducens]|uniref:lytic transglycosylase domain-containing protein n=1 Tax=Rhodoferax ferrireducens TaxID=192843 RepID=UPI000E0D1A33|nr:lytic transglycosylase domain-containing protein [Rhodoferax ferrireducens]
MMCAPAVDPVTMAAVVKQESGGRPWVVNNNTTRKSMAFASKAVAVAAAVAAVGRGESVDMGLAQINSKNLPALGLTVEQVFDPCTNIAAGANILAASYGRAGSLGGALSMYNTGRFDSKIGATYAQKVFGQAGVKVPSIPGGQLAKKLPETSSFAANPAAMAAVRLTVTPSPFAAGLSPVKTALQPANWR